MKRILLLIIALTIALVVTFSLGCKKQPHRLPALKQTRGFLIRNLRKIQGSRRMENHNRRTCL